jgi:CheY-like chemotaxis protein
MQSAPSVLLVDDDPDYLDALGALFSDVGFAVCTASDGREAAAYLRLRKPPDLVVLDLQMPIADGYTFLLEREKLQLPHTSVIVATGTAETNTIVGVDAVLRKPVRGDVLLATVYNIRAKQVFGSC